MIKARASGSKAYLYFMKKGRQARHRIPRNSCDDNAPCYKVSMLESIALQKDVSSDTKISTFLKLYTFFPVRGSYNIISVLKFIRDSRRFE